MLDLDFNAANLLREGGPVINDLFTWSRINIMNLLMKTSHKCDLSDTEIPEDKKCITTKQSVYCKYGIMIERVIEGNKTLVAHLRLRKKMT